MTHGRDLTLFKTALLRMIQVNRKNTENAVDDFDDAKMLDSNTDVGRFDWPAMEKELGEFTAAEFEALCDDTDRSLGTPALQEALSYIFENFVD